jgi:hypothetical protein
MALLKWLNGDLFSTLRDKVNAIVDTVNAYQIKVVNIGNWNMDSTATKTVAHGLDFTKIRTVDAMIIGDAGEVYLLLRKDGYESIDATNITLTRTTGGAFDSSTYSSSPFNRGYVTIGYIE